MVTHSREALASPTRGKRKGKAPPATAKPAKKSAWPKSLPEQGQAVRQQFLASAQPVTADELAKQFLRGNSDRIDEVLQSLVITGNYSCNWQP